MLKTFLSSFLLAFHNIRSHFFHTLLSVLGIVIGVAALVSILSLIDGMEKYAKEQIAKTTSINAIVVSPNLYVRKDGVRMKKDTFAVIQFNDFRMLRDTLDKPAKVHYMTSFGGTGKLTGKENDVGTMFFAQGSAAIGSKVELKAGELLTDEDIDQKRNVAAVNLGFVKVIDSLIAPANMIGKAYLFKDDTLIIKGVFDDGSEDPRLTFPLTRLPASVLREYPPSVTIEAESVEDVNHIKAFTTTWLQKHFGRGDDFSVATNTGRVEQAEQGFLLFRIIMGLIVGISVLVGGIGIMNVLLISITERTVEIGIRKAVGANRRAIILQFLAEALTVSVFGSLMGLILGVLGTMAVVPIVTSLTKIPFYAEYTMDTLVVVGVLAVLLGIVFGTYPAIRASRLDPVEAIRHE